MKNMTDRERQLYEDRGKTYGDSTAVHNNLGLIWTGLLQNHYGIILPHVVPGHLVATMTAALKLSRMARPGEMARLVDSFDDAKVYVEIARMARIAEEEEETR